MKAAFKGFDEVDELPSTISKIKPYEHKGILGGIYQCQCRHTDT